MIDYLLINKYVYRDAHGNIVAYAAHVPTLFEIKEFAKEKHAGTQTLIPPRGREPSVGCCWAFNPTMHDLSLNKLVTSAIIGTYRSLK